MSATARSPKCARVADSGSIRTKCAKFANAQIFAFYELLKVHTPPPFGGRVTAFFDGLWVARLREWWSAPLRTFAGIWTGGRLAGGQQVGNALAGLLSLSIS